MIARWYINDYNGNHAKSIKAHAEAGISYILIHEAGNGKEYMVRAAFRLPAALPQPPTGRYATEKESREFESRFKQGQGLPS